MKKHLLSINDISREEIESVLMTARKDFLGLSKRDIKKVPTLRGRTVIDLFYEKSTRTSTSFELAGKRLSADVINVKADASSVGKGESLKDTVLTLNAYSPDIIVIRHPHTGAPAFVSRHTGAHVINAGDGRGGHPTQCMLDIFSLQQTYEKLDGLKVAIVGDVLHSRVARSNIAGFKKMGMDVMLVAPPSLLPRGVEALGVDISHSLDDISKVDVVYLLRMQGERHEGANLLPSVREYISRYCVGRRHISKDQRVLHPGPINRGVEIDAELADSGDNLILQQVEAGLAVRMAIMYRIIIDNAAVSGDEQQREGAETDIRAVS